MASQTRASLDVDNGAEMIKEYRIGFWNFGNIVIFGGTTYMQILVFSITGTKPWWVIPLFLFLTIP